MEPASADGLNIQESHRIAEENAFRSIEAVDKVTEGKRLHIYIFSFLPGHKGVMGFEIANEMAKSAIRLSNERAQNKQ